MPDLAGPGLSETERATPFGWNAAKKIPSSSAHLTPYGGRVRPD